MKSKSLYAACMAGVAAAALSLFVMDARTSTAQAVVDGPEVNWRFSTWGNPRAFTKGTEHLAKRLEEETGGKFTLKVFHGEALSKAKENLDGLKLNAFDGANFCNFYHPGKNPAFMVFSLPFLPLGDWEVSARVRNELYKNPALVKDMAQWNAVAYVSTLLPQYEFLGKGKPPKTLEDWKGLRVRAGGGIGDAMEKLGAVRSTVPAPEVYTGLERGTMDAASLPYTYAHASYKIPEVTDWFTANLSPGSSDCPVIFNKTSYDNLPDQYKKLLEDLKPEVTQVFIEAYKAADAKNLPAFEKKLEKIEYDEATLEKFREVAGKPVWDEWVARNKDKFDAQNVLDELFRLAKESN